MHRLRKNSAAVAQNYVSKSSMHQKNKEKKSETLSGATGKVRSLYSEQIETDLCAACHAFILHVRARACVCRGGGGGGGGWDCKGSVFYLIKIFLFFLPFRAILGKNCLVKRAMHV